MNTLTRAQFKALAYLAQAKSENTVATVADSIGMSLADTDALLGELRELGYIADLFAVTEAGHEALEPYRARRVIFLAAGLGSRLRPATLNVPKPLVRVHGKPIICSAIEAALSKGIEEIYIVRGYLGGAFDQLKQMYPQIHLIDNTVYTQTNNVSSAMQVRHLFQHAYVMEADLLINNPDVFRKYNYTSNCVGVPVKKTTDWCVISENGVAKRLVQGGENCHHLYSIYYWNEEDGAKLPADLEDMFSTPEGKQNFWDIAPMNIYNSHYHIEISECTFEDITEIDTYHELSLIDPDYAITPQGMVH